jgi:hypothetical protein
VPADLIRGVSNGLFVGCGDVAALFLKMSSRYAGSDYELPYFLLGVAANAALSSESPPLPQGA